MHSDDVFAPMTTHARIRIPASIRDAACSAGRWCAVASLFVVPLNKPATNIALVLSLVFSLLGSDARQRWLTAARHPVAQGALLWWVVLMLSAMHTWYNTSVLPLAGSFVWVCWYPLVLGSLLQTPQWRRRALTAFALAVGLVLLISCGMYLGLIPQRSLTLAQPTMRNTVFKEYTQQGLALLVFASMSLAAALATQSRDRKILFLVAALLALINIVFMLESRTTYLTLIPLLAYWGWRVSPWNHWNWRSTLLACTLVLAIPAIIWFVPPVRERLVTSVTHEVEVYASQRTPTATGIRLELWRRSLPIIASAPIFGHGLHRWAPLYRQSIEGLPNFDAFLMGHPHQEMLLILAEQGSAGLLVYLLLLAALARYALRLNQPERDIYTCILLIYLSAGLANCLWADFSHRHMFILLLACIPLVGKHTSPQDA
ncbi:MAG: O-antigen ligase family protein [Rhodanobacter sp.]|nr:O-antigen ligase family protein [Rhodanobacter sp.]